MGKKQSNPPPPKGAIKPPPPTDPPKTTMQRIAEGIEQSNAIERDRNQITLEHDGDGAPSQIVLDVARAVGATRIESEPGLPAPLQSGDARPVHVPQPTSRESAIAVLHARAPFIAAMLETEQGMLCRTDEEATSVATLRKALQRESTTLRAAKKLLTEPHSKRVREINQLFKPSEDQLDKALDDTQRKLTKFAQDLLVIEGERKRAQLEQAREEQTRSTAEAAKMRDAGAPETAEIIEVQAAAAVAMASGPAHVKPIKGEDVTFSVRKHWEGRVLNLRALCAAIGDGRVPVECINVNLRALSEHARTLGEPLVALDPSAMEKHYVSEGFSIALVAEGATR